VKPLGAGVKPTHQEAASPAYLVATAAFHRDRIESDAMNLKNSVSCRWVCLPTTSLFAGWNLSESTGASFWTSEVDRVAFDTRLSLQRNRKP
jgi:hypothetical protein